MHASLIVDVCFASLMTIGMTFGLIKMYATFSGGWLPKDMVLILINTSWKNLFNLGWNSRYHLMTFWNIACLAAMVHWNMVFSGSVIAVGYVASMVTLGVLKYKLLHTPTLAA